MAQNSKIEWTHHTANLWWGCQKVHAGCDHCYAEALDKRWGGDHWGPDAPRRMILSTFNDLLNYQRKAAELGEIHRVFVGSMMDIFEKSKPLVYQNGKPVRTLSLDPVTTDKLRQDLFANISDGHYPNLMFLFLTKRPGNIMKYIPDAWKETPPANVMYGTSPVDQETANDMIPKLIAVPGRHFLSCEPLLGPIDFNIVFSKLGVLEDQQWRNHGLSSVLHWVIVGGESGHGARPMHPDWVRSLRNQCTHADIPFFFKQWGEWVSEFHDVVDKTDYPHSEAFVTFTEDKSDYYGQYMFRVGKKLAGRSLDGGEYSQLPVIKMEVQHD